MRAGGYERETVSRGFINYEEENQRFDFEEEMARYHREFLGYTLCFTRWHMFLEKEKEQRVSSEGIFKWNIIWNEYAMCILDALGINLSSTGNEK